MNKFVFFAGLLCVTSIVNVEAALNDDLKTSVELSQGYRRDSLNLKLDRDSFNGREHFKKIDVYTSRIGVNVMKDDYFLKGVVGYGNVYDGRLHRHTNNSNNSHSSKVKSDYTADFAVTFGKNMLMSDGWSWSPTVGYGVYMQDFHTKHHSKQKVKATWYSPQFGLSVQKVLSSTMNVYASYMCLYPLNYQGKMRHGNGSSHSSQENKAYKSVGNIGSIGFDWTFCNNWSLKPEIEGMLFYSKGGDSGHRYNFKKATRKAVEYRLVLSYMF